MVATNPMTMAMTATATNADPTLTDINYLNLQARYIKSRSIGALWAAFSVSFALINVIVFVQPQWLGDTELSRGTGYFGLWKSCRLLQDGQDLFCQGKLNDMSSIHTSAFRVSTIFVAISTLMTILCILAMLMFFFAHPCTVFQLCGWLQFMGTICLLFGVVIFPLGWSSRVVREVCGHDASVYNMGQCNIRWPYILAMVGVVDGFVLSTLAFVLGARHTKLQPDQYVHRTMVGPHYGSVLGLQAGNQYQKANLNHMYTTGGSQMSKLNKSTSSNPLFNGK